MLKFIKIVGLFVRLEFFIRIFEVAQKAKNR